MEPDALTEEYAAWRLEQGLEPPFDVWLLLGRMAEDAEQLGVIVEQENDDGENDCSA